MKKKAFITGITGQDGSYLAEYLLSKNYTVHGMVRRHSDVEGQTSRIEHLLNDIKLDYGDVTDASTIERLLRASQPDEVYNLAAQSQVRISFDMPAFTYNVNILGMANMLEGCRQCVPFAKFYQACSSEMFGNRCSDDGMQDENTPMDPVSPYGISKLFGYNLVRHYRRAYGMFAVNGILFNHESPRRGSNFISMKIVKGAIAIKKGLASSLTIGNIDTARDWGHSKDYVRAMYLMMHHKVADDFVVASGTSHTVREMCQYVFSKLRLNYEHYIEFNERYNRPEEPGSLCGSPKKAKEVLAWRPEYDFESMLDEMLASEVEKTRQK